MIAIHKPYLVLVRHGQSEWNEKNLFTGCRDVPLTQKGKQEAYDVGRTLKNTGMVFDAAYTSALVRAQDTLAIMLQELGQQHIPIVYDAALNERDYGDLIGLNKSDACGIWGEDQIMCWRRSYDVCPPGGESLKDTADRVLPFFRTRIEPDLRDGKSVLVVAHGNSLRALVMALEHITPEDIPNLNLPTGEPRVYVYREGVYTRV